MKLLLTLARVGINQARNVVRFLTGKPLILPPLESATLDQDDVELVKRWRKNRQDWSNTNIVSEYGEQFAKWNGSKYAFAFMSGRVALSACIYALDLQPGDEIILPGYTCVAVPNALHFAEITPIYCDIELETYGLDASLLETKINPKTRAILLHHLYGLVTRDYETILEIARQYNIYVIEDCAQSAGAEFEGKKVGNYGDMGFYSSEQSKAFNTIQGGMAVTNNVTLAERLREYHNAAEEPDAEWINKQLCNVILKYFTFKHPHRWFLGDLMRLRFYRRLLTSTTKEEEQGIRPAHYGRKMPAPIAALGLNQLNKLDRYNELRRQGARLWDAWCDGNGYSKPLVLPESMPIFLRYPVLVEPERKTDTSWILKDKGVHLGVWFTGKAHPVDLAEITGCPNADKAVAQCVNFPTVLT